MICWLILLLNQLSIGSESMNWVWSQVHLKSLVLNTERKSIHFQLPDRIIAWLSKNLKVQLKHNSCTFNYRSIGMHIPKRFQSEVLFRKTQFGNGTNFKLQV